ncbi:MAG: class II fructose-bisphosphate aldolase family protein [Actinomycetota bacterium]|jgi:fructose-bisphosphate aldolase class II|nr:class II fructose-bisphosphate aldolase family protein [Actinomycetota bacterium]
MPLVSSGSLVEAAVGQKTAVLAFNAITLEHAEAIVDAAQITRTALIIQISHNAVRFHGGDMGPLARAVATLATGSSVDIALHLDHVEETSMVALASSHGFSSVMFDAARFAYDVNVSQTVAARQLAHESGLWIEAELGYVGGKPNAPASAHQAGVRTDPDEAADFVLATGVDALAIAVGTSHAMSTRTAQLDHSLIERIARRVTVPLVLHGSSGVSADQLRAAIGAGISKINIGTALNQSFTTAVRDALADPAVVDPRRYLAEGRRAITEYIVALVGDVLTNSKGG